MEPTAQQVYVHDLTSGTTEVVSVSSDEVLGDGISAGEYAPSISGDGSLVAFESDATNLVAGDTNEDRDAFVRDRQAGTTVRVSVDEAGDQIDAPAPPVPEPAPEAETDPTVGIAGAGPAISGNGQTVVFESAVDVTADDSNGVVDVYLYDLPGQDLVGRASVAIAGGTDATGTRIDGNSGLEVPQVNGHDAVLGWSGLDVVFNGNGDLAADRPAAEEPVVEEDVSTEPAVFTRTRVQNPPATTLDAFSDVPADHTYAEEIGWAVDQGITDGYDDGTFQPAAPVSRQAASAFLWRLAGEPAGPFPDPGFSDVPTTHRFYTAIAWMASLDITEGYADGTFRPTAPVSRQAFAAFVHRFDGSDPAPFPDPDYPDVTGAHLFYDEVAWTTANGLTGGYPDGTFGPTNPVSRMAAVVILHRYVPVAAVS